MAISPKFIQELAQREVVIVDEEATLGDAVQKMIDAKLDERRALLVVRPTSGSDFRACVFAQLNQLVIQWLGAAGLEAPLKQLPIPLAARVLAINTAEETSGGAKNWLLQNPNAILIVYDDAGSVYLFCNVNMSSPPEVGGKSMIIIHGEMVNLSQDKRTEVTKKYPPGTCPYCKVGYATSDPKSRKIVCSNASCAKVLG